jgi:competence protein ComGC
VGGMKKYKAGIIYGILFIASCLLLDFTRGMSLPAFLLGITLYIPIDLGIYFFNRDHKIQWIIHFISVVLISTTVFILLPNFLRGRASGQIAGCQSNLENIATAIEKYAAEHDGYYPETFAELVPDYIDHIPKCQATWKDSYSKTYQVWHDPEQKIYRFIFYCEGSKHIVITEKPNYPQYCSERGMLRHEYD